MTGFPGSGYSEIVKGLLLTTVMAVMLHAPSAANAAATVPSAPTEDYALYDRVITEKFLTSETRLVVIERMTVPRLSPNQDGPLTLKLVQELEAFDGELPLELVRHFVAVNQDSVRLEGRFRFGVRYRFVSGSSLEEPEVSVGSPVSTGRVSPAELSPVLERLAFSRVGRTLRNDQALLYVELNRPDGTGAGFLIWFRRQDRAWTLVDTDVVWTVREEGEPDGGPALAP